MYGISLPFAAAVPPGTIFAGRRLDADGRYSVSWKANAAGFEKADRFAWDGEAYQSSLGDALMFDFAAIGTTPTTLEYLRVGYFSFTQPAEQTLAYYAGFETPTGFGPTAGTVSYQGVTIALETRGGTEYGLAGSVHLEADFHSNSIFGSINNLKLFDADGNTLGDYDYRFVLSGVTIADVGGSRTFSGDLIAQNLDDGSTTTSATTILRGRFFGPNTEEAGGVWQSDAIAGRQTWGMLATTTDTVGGVPSFLQSEGTPIVIRYDYYFEVNQATNAVIPIAYSGPNRFLTPLAGGGIDVSSPALGTFGAPGSSATPSLTSGPAFLPAVNARAVTGEVGTPSPSSVFLAERGTLSYARFGYWVDATRLQSHNVLEYSYFAAGVETAGLSIPASGTATYSGTSVGAYADGTNPVVTFAGKVNLVANFGARELSGSIHSLSSATPLPFDSIELGRAPYSHALNSIMGPAAAKSGSSYVSQDGEYQAGFYGPAANEVAGAFYLEAPGWILDTWGSFGASR